MNKQAISNLSANIRNDNNALALKTLGEPAERKNTALAKKTTAGDRLNVDLSDTYKSLSILAQKVLGELDEILKNDLPGGIKALNPEDHTPEKTADFIVNGTTALYAIYAKQNPNLEGEELLDSFMKTIRGGIQTGYQDAMSILEGIGALKFEGVGQGIAKTMQLVEEKLLAFENSKREQFSNKTE